LPGTRREVETLASLVADDKKMIRLDFSASLDEVASGRLRDYQFVHFATHGLLDSKRPEFSGLAFSLVDENGRDRDGLLLLQDIYELRLTADLVVLSACETGLGQEVQGEGVVGLTRAFLYSGAHQVVVSLWRVDDSSTAELMKRLYTGILAEHQPSQAALRQAQVAILKEERWQAPFFWAAFEIQGDWK
jgi:CHAT domain-containing protein